MRRPIAQIIEQDIRAQIDARLARQRAVVVDAEAWLAQSLQEEAQANARLLQADTPTYRAAFESALGTRKIREIRLEGLRNALQALENEFVGEDAEQSIAELIAARVARDEFAATLSDEADAAKHAVVELCARMMPFDDASVRYETLAARDREMSRQFGLEVNRASFSPNAEFARGVAAGLAEAGVNGDRMLDVMRTAVDLKRIGHFQRTATILSESLVIKSKALAEREESEEQAAIAQRA